MQVPDTGGPSGIHLDIQGIRFGYGSASGGTGRSPVLTDVSLSVRRGAITALLGPNGGGKTTLLSLAAGVLAPQAGRILLDGAPLDRLARREVARRIAMVQQETHAVFDYTVRELVLMGRHPHLGTFEVEGPDDLAIADDAMTATRTRHLADRIFGTLSGGERQRAALASALAQQPDLLLLDEPTSSLDLAYQLDIAGLLKTLNRERGMTIVFATHDLNLAASLADELVLLRGGRLLAQGTPGSVLTRESIRGLYEVDAEVEFHPDAGHLIVVATRLTR